MRDPLATRSFWGGRYPSSSVYTIRTIQEQDYSATALLHWERLDDRLLMLHSLKPIGRPLVSNGETQHDNYPETFARNWRGP